MSQYHNDTQSYKIGGGGAIKLGPMMESVHFGPHPNKVYLRH